MINKKIGLTAAISLIVVASILYGVSETTPTVTRVSVAQFGDFTFADQVERSHLVVIGIVTDVGVKIFPEDIIDVDEHGNEYVFEHNEIPKAEVTLQILEVLKDDLGWISDEVTFYDDVNIAVGKTDSKVTRFVSQYAMDYQKGDRGLFLINDDHGLNLSGYTSFYPIYEGKDTITTELDKLLEKAPIELSEAKAVAQAAGVNSLSAEDGDGLEQIDSRLSETKAKIEIISALSREIYASTPEVKNQILNAKQTIKESEIPYRGLGTDFKNGALVIGFQSQEIADQYIPTINTMIGVPYYLEIDVQDEFLSCTTRPSDCDSSVGGVKISTQSSVAGSASGGKTVIDTTLTNPVKEDRTALNSLEDAFDSAETDTERESIKAEAQNLLMELPSFATDAQRTLQYGNAKEILTDSIVKMPKQDGHHAIPFTQIGYSTRSGMLEVGIHQNFATADNMRQYESIIRAIIGDQIDLRISNGGNYWVAAQEELVEDLSGNEGICGPQTVSVNGTCMPDYEAVCGPGAVVRDEKCVGYGLATAKRTEDCLIATASYGSEMAPQVQMLREVRDNILLSTYSGTLFMDGFNSVYYSFSPQVAQLENENPVFKEAVKTFITPMISTLSVMTLANEGSESEVILFGVSAIGLIVGMYIATPVIAVWQVRKRI